MPSRPYVKRRPGTSRWMLAVLLSVVWGFGVGLVAQDLSPDGMQALEARSIGPAGMSGRIAAIDALASDPDVVYVGAATGGVWKSVNGGQTWRSLFDAERVLGIGAVAVNQSHPDIVWVGTGEGNPRNSAGVGAGIYKSMDGGETWTLLGLENSERIHRIVLHPSDPQVAYAGVMGPAWSDGRQRGVYRTRDGGATWEQVLFVNERTGVSDLVMDPTNPMKLFVGMWEFRRQPWFFESGGPGSGLYVTHNGGDTWQKLTTGQEDLGRIGLAIAHSVPEVVYALIEAETSALLRSGDGGKSWSVVNDGPRVAPRPFYYTDIYVDPTNELRLYNLHSRAQRSEDGGKSFETISDGVHPDFHALWIHPGDSRFMYLGTDGGIYVTRDRGENWRFIDNLPVGQFYHVSVDMAVPYNIYGGMQDNGSWRGPSDVWENGGIRNYHWQEVGFGDGFGTLMDPADPNIGYSMSQGGGLRRFDLRTGERKGIRPWAPDGVELRFNWNAAIAADPLNPGTLFYGSQFVHKTTDRGDTWQIISGDLTSNDPAKQRQEKSGGLTIDDTGAENHTTLLAIAPSPVEPEVIWTGSDDGRVHITRSSGGNWTEVGERADDVPEDTWVPHIEASKHDGSTAYVVFDDHRRGNWEPYVFRVEEYGRRWRRIAEEDDLWGFVHTLEEDPVSPRLLFAGTEFGLWVSFNRGRDWHPWRHGVPPAPVRSLVIHPRDHDLVIGTHGRALYVLDDIRPLRAMAENPEIQGAPVHLFQPPPAYLRSVSAVDGYHFAADAMFQGETREPGALLTYWMGQGIPDGEVTLEVLDEEGRVIRTFAGPAEAGMNRVMWNLREDPPGEPGGGRSRSMSLEVLPGFYTVRVQAAEAAGMESTAKLEILPDPRIGIPMAVRIEKRNALVRALAANGTFQGVQEGYEALEEGVSRILGLLDDRRDDEAQELRSLAGTLHERMAEVQAETNRVRRHRSAVYSMASSRDAPTEAERIGLARLEEGVENLAASLNALLVGPVADFRRAVKSADINLFPDIDLIQTGGTP